MKTAAFLAALVWNGGGARRDIARVRLLTAAAIGFALAVPIAAAIALGVAAVVGHLRSSGDAGREIEFHRRVAAHMSAGLGLRSALAAALETGPGSDAARLGRLLTSGQPLADLTGVLASMLPVTGGLAVAAVAAGERSGGQMRSIFAAMADLAADEAEIAREVHIETSASRLALWIVGGGPLLAISVLAVTGRMASLVTAAPGRLVLGLGLAMMCAGGGSALAILRMRRR
jgi:hypothetical protein